MKLLLTVQPRAGVVRYFSCRHQAERAPRVGDSVAIARYANSTPGSSAIKATVMAVAWTELTFEEVNVFLSSHDPLVRLETLIDADDWVDEDNPYPLPGDAPSLYSYEATSQPRAPSDAPHGTKAEVEIKSEVDHA